MTKTATKKQTVALGGLIMLLLAVGCATSGKPSSKQVQTTDMDEPALMEMIRGQAKSDPTAALAMVEDGERRFGNSPFAEERQAAAIQALIDLNRIGAARSRAYPFLERYPNGHYSAHVAAMTGVHVIPNGPADPTRP